MKNSEIIINQIKNFLWMDYSKSDIRELVKMNYPEVCKADFEKYYSDAFCSL